MNLLIPFDTCHSDSIECKRCEFNSQLCGRYLDFRDRVDNLRLNNTTPKPARAVPMMLEGSGTAVVVVAVEIVSA